MVRLQTEADLRRERRRDAVVAIALLLFMVAATLAVIVGLSEAF